MKALVIQFSDGNTFAIPATVIAESRTNYYACEVDGYEKNSPEWQEEYEFSLNDDFQLRGWMNNMKWSELEQHAIVIKSPDCDYNSEWLTQYKKFEEIDEETLKK